jgi:hypothetical protein
MSSPIAIDRVFTDNRMLGAALGAATSWATWLAALRAAFGLPLEERDRELFASIAGDRQPPTRRVREFWCLVGRRGGKSRIAALTACYLALFSKPKLAPGETGVVVVLRLQWTVGSAADGDANDPCVPLHTPD